MIEITKELRKKFRTDSDLMDYAEENGLSLRELSKSISLYDAIGTPCEGCEHVEMHNGPPCLYCSRGKTDMWEPAKDIKTKKIVDIVWDTEDDGEVYSVEELGLPTKVSVPEEIDDDDIADYLSDIYEWCIVSFCIEK